MADFTYPLVPEKPILSTKARLLVIPHSLPTLGQTHPESYEIFSCPKRTKLWFDTFLGWNYHRRQRGPM
ncbi:MAG: hypothetical protein JWR69_281 [Pedosphaera sp.]|nr:hypothetical protein [Pedosphaera sp.]